MRIQNRWALHKIYLWSNCNYIEVKIKHSVTLYMKEVFKKFYIIRRKLYCWVALYWFLASAQEDLRHGRLCWLGLGRILKWWAEDGFSYSFASLEFLLSFAPYYLTLGCADALDLRFGLSLWWLFADVLCPLVIFEFELRFHVCFFGARRKSSKIRRIRVLLGPRRRICRRPHMQI